MDIVEKVKKGFEAHGSGPSVWRICGKCPYREEDDPFFDPRITPNYNSELIEKSQKCMDNLLKDACFLLTAAYSEPRVMTLEEVQQMGLRNINKDDIDDPDEVCYLERTERLSAILCSPLWSKKEFDGDENHLAILFFFLATDEFDNWHVDTYGHVIRCWTRPPTKEQMEATPWE